MSKQIMLALVLLNLWSVNVSAAEPKAALNQFDAAKQVAALVVDVVGDTREVFVREFRGVGESHVGLARLIGESLQNNHKVEIRRGAAVEVEGRLKRFPLDDRQALQGYTISVTVTLATGDRRFSIDVENSDEAKVNVEPPGEFVAPPSRPVGTAPEKSGLIVDGTIVRPSSTSPYGVEVVVERGSKYVPVKPKAARGQITVDVRQGDIVALRLHNRAQIADTDTKFEAAVAVLVDGLSRFALADDPTRRGGLDLVSQDDTRLIKGYFRDDREVDSFRIGEYSKSPAVRLLPEPSAAGTFTVSFRAAWKKGTPPPANEPSKTKNPPGVEQGPKRYDPTISVERDIGAVRAVIKIFYAAK